MGYRNKNTTNTGEPSALALYNGMIADMRRKGHTLQSIGDTIGRTREDVRKILKKHYPNAKPESIPEYKVAELLGCGLWALRTLRLKGTTNPVSSTKICRYNKEEIEKARVALEKTCKDCGTDIPIANQHWVYCSKCAEERRRNQYPFLSPEQKKKHSKCVMAWMRRNPERAKIIQDRAWRAQAEREKVKHFATTTYRVVRGDYLPIGITFRAVRCVGGYLELENGTRIPVGCVKIDNISDVPR